MDKTKRCSVESILLNWNIWFGGNEKKILKGISSLYLQGVSFKMGKKTRWHCQGLILSSSVIRDSLEENGKKVETFCTFIPDCSFQGSRSQNALQGWLAREHDQQVPASWWAEVWSRQDGSHGTLRRGGPSDGSPSRSTDDGNGSAPPAPPPPNPECDMKDLNKMFGMTASDIDKYSRVIFPVTFTCFQLMYWIIYRHLSDDVVDDLVYLNPD